MQLEELLSELTTVHLFKPSRPAPLSEVPRVIFLALDAFGERVLRTLDEEWPQAVPAFKRKLSVFLRYQAGQGFQMAEINHNGQSGSPKGPPNQSRSDMNGLDQEQLIRALYKVRERVCSLPIQATLRQQGFRISSQLEVYVVAEIKEMANLRFLETVVGAVRGYLQRFEPVRITLVVNLAEYERPLSEANERTAVIDGLNQLLSEHGLIDASLGKERPIERCYIVTHETMSGQSVIPKGKLATRTANFLAMHYLDSLRQPMTPQQHLFFGRQTASGLDLTGALGLCEVFGYASLGFDFNHVLEWCALVEAGRILREVFLARRATSNEMENAERLLERELEAAAITLSVQKLMMEVLNKLTASENNSRQQAITRQPDRLLSDLRQRRQKIEELQRNDEKKMAHEVQQIREKLATVLTRLLDRHITTHPQGLRSAEAILGAIEARCRDEEQQVRHKLQQQADFNDQLNRRWAKLSKAVRMIPPNSLFGARLVLFILIIALNVLLNHVVTLGLAAVTAIVAIVWIVYVYVWLPRRIDQHQKEFQQDLKQWQESHLRLFAQQQLLEMISNLRQRFAKASTAQVEAGSEWNALQAWREKLTDASRLCQKSLSSSDGARSSQEELQPKADTRQGELTITQGDLQKYYERLTTPHFEQNVLESFIQRYREKVDWWRAISPAQLVSRLRQACRQRYEQELSQEIKSLEHHLLEINSSGDVQIETLLDTLIEEAQPMARFNRFHSRWLLPKQRLLIVHDAEHSSFREPAHERGLQLISGASPQQIICVQTVHHVPVYDLALANDP